MSADSPDRTLGEIAADVGTTDRLAPSVEGSREAELIDTATNSEGSILQLTACPTCGKPFGSEQAVRQHLEARDPEHFGLSPRWGGER